MNDLMVSLDIVTSSAKVADITSLLGIAPSPDKSHDLGSPRSRGTSSVTVWSLISPVDESAPLAEHLASLFTQISKVGPERFARLPKDARIYLGIGAFCEGPNMNLRISPDLLKEMADLGMGVEVSFYVCENRDD